MTHAQIVRAVQHAAVSVAAPVDHIAVALSGSNIHHGTMELLHQQGLGGLGTEVAQEHHQSVHAVGADISQRSQSVLLVLHGNGALINAFAVSCNDVLPALGGQRDGEAVTRDSNDTQFYFRNVHMYLLL